MTRTWKSGMIAEARRMLAAGSSTKDVGEVYGCSPGAVREALRRASKTEQRVEDLRTVAGGALSRLGAAAFRKKGQKFFQADPAKTKGGKRRIAGPARTARPFERDCEEGVKVYVVATDVHVPYHDKVAVGAMADLMRDLRPDGLVLGGDFLDLIEVSRHSSSSVAQLEGLRIEKSFDEGRHVLRTLRAAGGEQMTDNHYIEGNHENRLDRWVQSGDNAVWMDDDAVSIENRLDLDDLGFKYHAGYPEATVYLGKLAVTHGIWTSKHHAATHLDRFKHAVLYGHTHAPQLHYGSTLKGKTAAFGLGHMADPDSPAMKYAPKPNSWCSGFGIVYVRSNGEFCVQQIQLWNGTFFYAGRQYGKRK